MKQLGQLIDNLGQRVQNDKEVLVCVGQIRRIDPSANADSRPAAGLLMNFSRGCEAVLGLMGQISMPSSPSSNSTNSCGSDGYHSDSDFSSDEIQWVVVVVFFN